MLKVGSGILNDDPVEFAEGSALLVAGAVTQVGTKVAAESLRFGWTSGKALASHFRDHGGELGFKVLERYAAAGQRFAATAGAEGVETVTLSNGSRYIYNRATKEFAMESARGKLISYHKMSLKKWMKRSKPALHKGPSVAPCFGPTASCSP